MRLLFIVLLLGCAIAKPEINVSSDFTTSVIKCTDSKLDITFAFRIVDVSNIKQIENETVSFDVLTLDGQKLSLDRSNHLECDIIFI